MVTQWLDRKDTPDVSLELVKRLAASEAVQFEGFQVQIDTQNLGLGVEAVCDCLQELKAEDFRQSERYTERGPWHDVYLIYWRLMPLYVKFKVTKNCLILLVCSFHRERGS